MTSKTPKCAGPEGMALRDWFASQAMGVLMAASFGSPNDGRISAYKLARDAYKMADAMLAAREGENDP